MVAPHNRKDKNKATLEKARCLELKAQGKTVREIAAAVGLSTSVTQRRLNEACDDIISPRVEDYRIIQDKQLDELESVVFGIIMDLSKAEDVRLKAIDRATRLLERRARLHGLDSPVRVEGTVTHQTKEEVELAALYADQFAAIDATNEAIRHQIAGSS